MSPQEPRNRFFVLLSESCMPLYPPQTVYQQLVHSQQSRINACRKDYKDNRDVRRWTHKMTSGAACACCCRPLPAICVFVYVQRCVQCVHMLHHPTTVLCAQRPLGFSSGDTGGRAGSGLGSSANTHSW